MAPRSILFYGCVTWPVREADERMLEVFDNDSIRRILHVRRRDCVPSVELRLRWFGDALRRGRPRSGQIWSPYPDRESSVEKEHGESL